jgi:chromosome segregation ATPase
MNAWDRYMYSKTARETADALQELRRLAELAEAAKASAAELQAQLDTANHRIQQIEPLLIDEAVVTEMQSQLTTLRATLASERIGRQNDNEDLARMTRARNDLVHDLADAIEQWKLHDRDAMELTAQLADARIEIGILTETNAALARRWAETRPKTPSIGDTIRAIWAASNGSRTNAECGVVSYMAAHDSYISLEHAKTLLWQHVPEYAAKVAAK